MPERGKHLFLTGMMGSGKSSCGRALAARLHCDFIDLDKEIVKMRGKSIEAIFRDEGEAAFRNAESACAIALELPQRSVIATGGGFPLRSENRDWMRRLGTLIWLRAEPEKIAERVSGGERPLLKDKKDPATIGRILDARKPFYAEADLHIDTGGHSIEGVVDIILKELEKWKRSE